MFKMSMVFSEECPAIYSQQATHISSHPTSQVMKLYTGGNRNHHSLSATRCPLYNVSNPELTLHSSSSLTLMFSLVVHLCDSVAMCDMPNTCTLSAFHCWQKWFLLACTRAYFVFSTRSCYVIKISQTENPAKAFGLCFKYHIRQKLPKSISIDKLALYIGVHVVIIASIQVTHVGVVSI